MTGSTVLPIGCDSTTPSENNAMINTLGYDRFPSRREFFGSTIKHLLRQRVRSGTNDECYYRGPTNRMCAIGLWIPQSEYCSDLEGLPVIALGGFRFGGGGWCPSVRVLAGMFGIELLDDLQRLHDNMPTFNTIGFAYRANAIAAKYNLPAPFVLASYNPDVPGNLQHKCFTYHWCK